MKIAIVIFLSKLRLVILLEGSTARGYDFTLVKEHA